MNRERRAISSFTVIVAFIAVALVGCALLPLIPVRLAPSRSLPGLSVSFSMPGVSARAVEGEVTGRLESLLSRVNGVKHISSASWNGGGSVSIEFDRHANLDIARFEVSNMVRQAWYSLPEGVSYPSVSARRADADASGPFMVYLVNAPANPNEILRYVEDNLKPLLVKIKGIDKVELSGAMPMEWRLQYDMPQLASLGLTPDHIRNAISDYYSSENLGMAMTVDDNGQKQWIRLMMSSSLPGTVGFDIDAINVVTPKGALIPLKKLVTVSHEEMRPGGYFRINGLNSVYVNITADDNANQLQLSQQITDVVEKFKAAMTPGYMLTLNYAASDTITEELNKIYFRTGLTVLILLLFLGLITRNFRYVVLISLCLAVNNAVAVLFYYLSGVEIQLYSLAGITISLNLVIDNLIVMADHLAKRGNLRAFPSILAATLTTIGALSVVFFMDEATRLSLQDFVMVVIINLSVSLAVALLLVPALMQRLRIVRRPSGQSRIRRFVSVKSARLHFWVVSWCLRHKIVMVVILVFAFGLPVFMIPEKIEGEGKWAGLYNATLGSATYKEHVKPITDMIFGGALRLFAEKVYTGGYFTARENEPVLSINATLPSGATLDQMDAIIKRMEAYLAKYPQIRQFQTSINDARHARISVFFKKKYQRNGFPYQLKGDVISKVLTIGGGSWSVSGLEDMGFNNDVRETAGSYKIKLTGYNYDDLTVYAEAMRDTLLQYRRIKEVTISSNFSWWKEDYREFYLDIDREKLAQDNLTTSDLFVAITPMFGRDIGCGTVTGDDGLEQIRLSARQSSLYDIWAMMNIPITIGDRISKLSRYATIEKRQLPQDIVKEDQQYVQCIQYDYIGAYKQGNKVQQRVIETMNQVMPVGYNTKEEFYSYWHEENSSQYWLLLLVIAIIFFVSSILFNSLRQPVAIIMTIPVSFIGVFLSFYLFKFRFDQGGFASFILLSGITVNAAIYIINEFNNMAAARPRMSKMKTYMTVFRLKTTPIFLTVSSTVLGFLPFIIESDHAAFWFPLAVGTIGGLIMSMVAIFIYLPLFLNIHPKSSGSNHAIARK